MRGQNNNKMKAKVTPAFNKNEPEKDCYMIAIQTGAKGSKYNKYLAENGKPYWTYHKEEAIEKVEKLNKEFAGGESVSTS